MNPALFTGATAPPAAMQHGGPRRFGGRVHSGHPSLGGSAVSAGMGRATLVGAMSVPQSWAAATPGTGPPVGAASAGKGWYMPRAAEVGGTAGTPGVPGMPGMPMAGLRRTRLRLCRSPLWVPSHRRGASAGCRIAEGEQRRDCQARHTRYETSELAPNSAWTSTMSRTGSAR